MDEKVLTPNDTTERTLHMVYALENGSKLTHELKDPKQNLTRNAVETVMQGAVDKEALSVNGFLAIGIMDAYIIERTRKELA